MNRLLILSLLALAISSLLGSEKALAQNDVDALRYSIYDYGSTARVLGTGNAFGAMGGDFGSISINPAGIGVYRSSEIAFSPGLNFNSNDASYYGQTSGAQRAYGSLGNLSIVLSSADQPKRANKKFGHINTSFGVGLNRIASYHREFETEGFNPDNSMLNAYLEFLNNGDGTQPSDVFNQDAFGAGLAYETFLINPTPDSNYYYSEIPSGGVLQNKRFTSRGSNSELTIALGANFGHKLYIGGAFGIPRVNYTEEIEWTETDSENTLSLDNYKFKSTLNTEGTGINFKIGAIFRPAEMIRLGLSIHSPTRFTLSDDYFASINSEFDDGSLYEYDSPRGTFRYRLRTPWRATGSIGFMLKDKGFITLDYEHIDYGFAAFNYLTSDEQAAEQAVNDLIADKYRAAGNLRAGIEIRADKFRIRGGYGLLTSPFKAGRAVGENDFAAQTFTAGLGYRADKFYIDLAGSYRKSNEYDIQYNLASISQVVQGAAIDRTDVNVLLTGGFRF